MIIVGLNLPQTIHNKELHDGGVCIIVDGIIRMAIAEERISRRKGDGGYNLALKYAMKKLGIRPADIDAIVFSSCCEMERQKHEWAEYRNAIVLSCNHHLSHANSVYCTSPHNEAIIIVLDAGGQVFGLRNPKRWWHGEREQQSYYEARGDRIRLIGIDFRKPGEAGIGEIYRAFTYYLGWTSSRHASKTMALAGYGNPGQFRDKEIYYFRGGRMRSHITNLPNNPYKMVDEILRKYGIRNCSKRKEGEAICQSHKDLAYWVQKESENAIYEKIKYLMKRTGIKNVCLAGGVAYNCSAIGKIIERTGAHSVYVHPASGDHGQCVGNAIYGYKRLVGPWRRESIFNPFLGGEEEINMSTVKNALVDYSGKYKLRESNSIEDDVADILRKNEIVAWFQGRSEYGPRALGNRSILAHPAFRENTYYLNDIKGRDNFMPFAPSVLADDANAYFDIIRESPYMTFAFKVNAEKRGEVPAVVHIDGSSRIQTVHKDINPMYYRLIRKFKSMTKIPMVVNTSFNCAGEPMVETIRDAVHSFGNLAIKYLAIGNVMLEKRVEDGVYVIRDTNSQKYSYDMRNTDIFRLRGIVKSNYRDVRLLYRKQFNLYKTYVDWLISGKKITTIRYRNKGIDFPTKKVVPLYSTEDFSPRSEREHVGDVIIRKYTVKRYCDLDDRDAANDGFTNTKELKKALKNIYVDIRDEDYVSVYEISRIL